MPLVFRLKHLKTKNSRMGKGKGGSKTFFIIFHSGYPVFKFKEKPIFFFIKLQSFLQKSLAKFLTFLF